MVAQGDANYGLWTVDQCCFHKKKLFHPGLDLTGFENLSGLERLFLGVKETALDCRLIALRYYGLWTVDCGLKKLWTIDY